MSEERDFYIGADGLEYCKHCNTPRERVRPHPVNGKPFKVQFMCECQHKAYEIEKLVSETENFIPSIFFIIAALILLVIGYKRKNSSFETN